MTMETAMIATPSKSAHRYWLLGLAAVALIYLARIGGSQDAPAFGGATSTYIVSAQSLANHTGYRLVNYPDAPLSLKFPIGYPFLLSLIFRILPFGSTSIFAARLLTVASAIIWIEASRRLLLRVVSPFFAAAAALATALAPLTVDLTGQVLSDMLFAAIFISTILLALPDPDSQNEPRPLTRGILLGLLAAAAMLVRTIGFTLIVGLAVEMLLRRKWSRLLGFASTVAVTLGPWLLWCSLHQGGTFHSYTAQNDITWRTPVTNFLQLLSKNAPEIAFAPLGTGVASHLHLTSATILLGVILVALVVIGWAKLLLDRHVIALVLAPYMAIVFMWWWEPSRFIVPTIPLFVFCAVVGARTLAARSSIPLRKIAFAAIAACIVGSLLVDLGRIDHVWRDGDWDGPASASDWAQLHQGLDWIKRATPQDARVYCTFPEAVYLFTDRQTLKLDPTTNLDSQLASANHPIFIYATLRRAFIQADTQGNAPVERFIADHPGRLKLQWTSHNGLATIYQFLPPPGAEPEATARS